MGLLLFAACVGEEEPDRLTVRVDSLGVEVVENRSPDRPIPARFHEEARIGGADSGPSAFFGVSRNGLAALGDTIVVLDGGNRQISLFDPTGRHLRSFGAEGDGPGELRSPASLTVAPNGEILVRDFRKPSLVGFHPDGTPFDGMALPPGTSRIEASRGGILSRHLESTEVEGTSRQVLEWRDNADSLVVAAMQQGRSGGFRLESCGIGLSGLPPVFAPELQWATDGVLVVFSQQSSYDLRWDSAGILQRIVRRAVPNVATTADMVLAELGEGMSIGLPDGTRRLCEPEELMEKRGYAPEVPAVTSIIIGPEHVWVQREVPGETPGPIDWFTHDGEYVGTLPSTSPFPAAFLSDGRFLTLEEDEFEIEYVVVYRVERQDL